MDTLACPKVCSIDISNFQFINVYGLLVSSDDCSLLNNCHRYGRCVEQTPGVFQCRCNPGFNGDGYKCFNATGKRIIINCFEHN